MSVFQKLTSAAILRAKTDLQRKRQPRRPRRLQLESLECRALMAGLPGIPAPLTMPPDPDGILDYWGAPGRVDESVEFTKWTTQGMTVRHSENRGAVVEDFYPGYFDKVIVHVGGGNDWVRNSTSKPMEAHGGVGNDTLIGSSGNDTLLGEEGNDVLEGGDGNDRLEGDINSSASPQGYDVLRGGAGNDILLGRGGNDRLYGDNGNDELYGSRDDDELWGGTGEDKLWGGETVDITNGDGNDTLHGDDGNDELRGGTGNDTLWGGNGDDKLWGGGIGWIRIGNDGDDALHGDSGNDQLDGGDATNTLDYGPNNLPRVWIDSCTVREGDNKVALVKVHRDLPEDRILSTSVQYALVDSNAKFQEDYVWSLRSGSLTFSGDEAEKVFNITIVDNTVYEEPETFYVKLSGAKTDGKTNAITGDTATVTINDNDLPPHPIARNDSYSTAKNSPLDLNLLANDNANTPRIISTEKGQINSGGQSVHYLPSVDFVGTDSFQYTIQDARGETATALVTIKVSEPITGPVDPVDHPDCPDWLQRTYGHWTIRGTDQDDRVLVTASWSGGITVEQNGVSWYLGSPASILPFGDIIFQGRSGNDYFENRSSIPCVVNGGAGNDTLIGGIGDDRLYGDEGDDRIRGGAGDDQLHGGTGNDTLISGAGDDLLHGGTGNDMLDGEDGSDRLDGGAGNDEIRGGAGNDDLIAGPQPGDVDTYFSIENGVPPAAPTNLLAYARARTVDLTWTDNATNETGFRIAISRDLGATWENVGVVGVNATSFRVENLPPGTRYQFKVRAANGSVYSDYSNAADVTTVEVTRPTNLRATTGARAVDLTWKDNATNETGYRIAISRDGGATWDNVGVVGANATSFRVENMKPGTRYLFKVRAVKDTVYSDYSDILDIRTNR